MKFELTPLQIGRFESVKEYVANYNVHISDLASNFNKCRTMPESEFYESEIYKEAMANARAIVLRTLKEPFLFDITCIDTLKSRYRNKLAHEFSCQCINLLFAIN